jgi:hypothetical protein
VDPVPDPLLLRKSDSAGNRTQISGPVVRNADHGVCLFDKVNRNTTSLYMYDEVKTNKILEAVVPPIWMGRFMRDTSINGLVSTF